NLARFAFLQARYAEADKLLREALIYHFQGLNDEELCRDYRKARNPRDFFRPLQAVGQDLNHREAYLCEIARRGGTTIEAFLTSEYKELSKEPKMNLEVLTALRRAQKKRDPLAVVVYGAKDLDAVYPRLPHFVVSLKNADAEELPFRCEKGGDYRSGRQARWRFDVRDSQGNACPVEPPPFRHSRGIC